MTQKLISFLPSSFETIDFAVYDFINEKMNTFCTTNKGWNKVPVIWSGAERSKQSKDNPDNRDITNALIFPIISIERTSQDKNNDSKGKFYANIPPINDEKGGSITILTRIKQDKTSNFANANSFKRVDTGQINFPRKNKKIVYEVISIPQPVYCQVGYKIKIKTEYQQQMNEILQPFIIIPGSIKRVMIERDKHIYEAFIESEFNQTNNTEDMSEDTRLFETEINIKVYGYLIGADSNQKGPYITIRETAAEIKIQRERVIFGDIPDFKNGNKFRP